MTPASFTAPDRAALHADGTVTGLLTAEQATTSGLLFSLTLPTSLPANPLAGRYFLVRCCETTAWALAHDWTFSLRRPLYVAGRRPAGNDARWLLASPALDDPGLGWLASRPLPTAVHLVGPLGNGFTLPPRSRHLAVVAAPERVTLLLPLVHALLDRGGQVAISLLAQGPLAPELRDLLPLAAEIQQIPFGPSWPAHLRETLAWADTVAAALPASETPQLHTAVAAARLHIEPGTVQVLADVPLACGYGVCQCCLTPLANGRWSRACIHGPVFDLTSLAHPA
jgi:dihydroorotate dehydrogenase electron transfer subunit